MLLGARQFFERRGAPTPPLPYDAEVEYLEGTGTQWIDTGISGRNGILTRVVGSLTDVDSVNRFFRAYYSNRLQFSSGVSAASNNYFVILNMSGSGNTSVQKDTDWHEFVIQSVSGDCWAKIDGVTVLSGSTIVEAGVGIIHLFQASSTAYSRCKISAFSVRDTSTNELIIDLIPVRKNGVGYMYDRVSGQLLGNAGTGDFVLGPDKPYDYEVAYIERDCSVPWVDDGGTEIEGYFDMSRYSDPSETLGTMRPLEATWSFEPIKVGNIYAIYRMNGFIVRGCAKTNNRTTYTFAGQNGWISNTEGNLDTFHKQRLIYQDGYAKGYIDDILAINVSTGGTTILQSPRVFFNNVSTSSTRFVGKARVKNVRIGSDVDLIPVVKGNAVGFYNKVDGELFLEEQACLSAGPRV